MHGQQNTRNLSCIENRIESHGNRKGDQEQKGLMESERKACTALHSVIPRSRK